MSSFRRDRISTAVRMIAHVGDALAGWLQGKGPGKAPLPAGGCTDRERHLCEWLEGLGEV